MPGTRCTVAVCNNSFEKTKRAGMNIMYHQFPKIQPFRNIWIERCRRAGSWNPNSCHVCSIHFTENDYRSETTSDVLHIPGKRRLKSTAIPSLFLTEPPPLGLMTLTQRKRKKIPIDDEESITFNNDSFIYFKLEDANTQEEHSDNVPVYEICESENSNQESIIYVPQEEHSNAELTHTEDLECYYVEENQSAVEKPNEIHSTPSRPLQYVTVQDRSTQTSPDYFLENYKHLIDKNESLENELLNWSSRYKKLMSTFRILKSELQRLTLNERMKVKNETQE